MKVYAAVISVLAAITVATAELTAIKYTEVRPLAEPEPETDIEKAAVKFKPRLTVTKGCHPYPAVDAEGRLSNGLEWGGDFYDDCAGSPLSSQIYSRAEQYDDKWVIMYAWYFPKARQDFLAEFAGHRHMWQWVLVVIDDPAAESPEVLSVSMSAGVGFHKCSPPKEKYFDGDSVKLESYEDFTFGKAALQLTEKVGGFQALIQWDQLTDAARESLNTVDYDGSLWNFQGVEMPLKDDVFLENVGEAWPL